MLSHLLEQEYVVSLCGQGLQLVGEPSDAEQREPFLSPALMPADATELFGQKPRPAIIDYKFADLNLYPAPLTVSKSFGE